MNDSLQQSIRLGRGICDDLGQGERREWWIANGRGAYASGTIAGMLTRRYHGLLTAPLQPPLGRFLVFAKADAVVTDGDREWPLFSNRWGDGIVNPHGYVHLESFSLDGRMPVWRFDLGGPRIEMRIWLEPGADTVYVAYRLDGGAEQLGGRQPRLNVRLLVNARDHHGNTAPGEFYAEIKMNGGNNSSGRVMNVAARVPGHDRNFNLQFQVRGGVIKPEQTWHQNFELAVERERGLPSSDNHLCVGEAQLELRPGEWVGFVASLHEGASPYLEEAMRRFRAHDANALRRAAVRVPELRDAPDWIKQLVLAADGFIFSRPLPQVPDGESVIAGYPWFGDWGRDTMIALPGLTLATGRYESAKQILETFARFVDGGMLPNVFPGAGAQPDYNTVDAALWFIEAWRAYWVTVRDLPALKQAYPVLAGIIDAHVTGTRYRIQMDPADGLLRAGEPGVQLTWMDAKVGDWVVTPRIGKPVEINALWYNALQSMAEFAEALHLPPARYREMAIRTGTGFQRFVRPDGRGLFDVIDGPHGDDASVRPNQIFAVSLAHVALSPKDQVSVVKACFRELLCGVGLRSLSPEHPDFRAQYVGGVLERDGGYHQGPVWPWLLGHYALAEYRVQGSAEGAQARLESIRDHLLDAGIGTVSEIFDGAPPHAPRGAPSQAWSVACILEAWWRLESIRQQQRTGDALHATGNN